MICDINSKIYVVLFEGQRKLKSYLRTRSKKWKLLLIKTAKTNSFVTQFKLRNERGYMYGLGPQLSFGQSNVRTNRKPRIAPETETCLSPTIRNFTVDRKKIDRYSIDQTLSIL